MSGDQKNEIRIKELRCPQSIRGEAELFKLGYRPALDGLRGVAILMVVATHAKAISGWFGDVGVNIFFVLSGFLITSLLLEEWDRFHGISLRRFYARRALRLLPALVVMIGALVLWHCLVSPRATGIRTALDGAIALFYSTNWMFALGLRQPVHVFAHTWTLSIEEQFYLTWPLILVLLLRRTGSRASLLRWVLLGMFLLAIESVLILIGIPAPYNWLNYATDARANVLLTGCIAGIVLCSTPIIHNEKFKRVIKCLAWLIGIPGLLSVNLLARVLIDFDLIGLEITSGLCAVLILVEAVISEKGVLARLLSQRWLVYVGKISYGLYLWHYPVFSEVQMRHWPLQYEVLVEVGLTILATLVSFYLIELPALRLKRRFGVAERNREEGTVENAGLIRSAG